MKIGIDATALATPFPCGTKHYANELIKHLLQIDKENEYVIFCPKRVEIPKQKNIKLRTFPKFLPVFKRQIFLAHAARSEDLDVFHYLEPFGSVFFRHPNIVTTIHDLNLSKTYPVLSKLVLNRLYCEIVRYGTIQNTKVFITPTKTIEDELRGYLKNQNSLEILTIHEGVGKDFRPLKGNRKSLQKYFLCMGDFAPRKNIAAVIEAYANLPTSVRKTFLLTIIASTPSAAENFRKLCKENNTLESTRIKVRPSKQQLIKLYYNATIFLYPSLYEGFSLPILEAMSSGCPVITSNFGAMKEVAGNAALFVNPKSKKDITSAILKLSQNSTLRRTMVKNGLKHTSKYSWKKTAEKTLKLYINMHKHNM